MQLPIMPQMSPAEEQREHKAKVEREGLLQRQLQACLALLDAVETGILAKDTPRMTARMIQQTFPDSGDRALRRGVVGEVLAQVGVFPGAGYYVQPWQIVEANDALGELAKQLRDDLLRVRRHLGRE